MLIDDIHNRSFLLAALDARVADLMDNRFVALKVTDDQETAVKVIKREDRYALPVTDSDGALLGIGTIDDVLNVAEAEATEAIQKIGDMEARDEPYMQIALLRMVKKRAGWLVIPFLGEMMTATAMSYFEDEIAKAVVLALFVPELWSDGYFISTVGAHGNEAVIKHSIQHEGKEQEYKTLHKKRVRNEDQLALF